MNPERLFFLHQVPIVVPILLVLASIYLVVAPFYEAPVESFFCLLFILAGIPFYLVFVYFNVVPRSFFDGIGRLRFSFFLFYSRFERSCVIRILTFFVGQNWTKVKVNTFLIHKFLWNNRTI